MAQTFDIVLPRPKRSVIPPPPPPRCDSNVININIDSTKTGGMNDLAVTSALQAFNDKIYALQSALAELQAKTVELGETVGTAYPGNYGKQNADNISLLLQKVQLIEDTFSTYAKIADVTQLIQDVEADLMNVKAELSADITLLSSTKTDVTEVQNIVQNMLQPNENDFDDLMNNINDLQGNI